MMRLLGLYSILVAAVISGAWSCKDRNGIEVSDMTADMKSKINIRIGQQTFSATVEDNAASRAWLSQLPMTVQMIELNGNEKYVDLPQALPTQASNPGDIQAGDIMLYGSNTLVLFYKSFATSYRYTRLGKVDDATGLAAALGRGDISVTFEQK